MNSRTFAILKALARAQRRDQKSIETLAGNNFFLVTVLLLQQAGAFIYLIIGLIALFPLSTDPLRKIPASRLQSWPLENRQRWWLRLTSPWVNPVTWLIAVAAFFVIRGKVSVGLWAMGAGLVTAAFAASLIPMGARGGWWRSVPHFPGLLDQLIRKNLRELLCTLDFYCALLLSLATLGFRIGGIVLPPEGLMAMTVLMVLALSSYAQCLFGLDGAAGLERYRLMPLRGWQILAAKDAAFLAVVLSLTLPLSPLSGLAAAWMALAVGRHATVAHLRPQVRWRFSSGAPLMEGLAQAALLAMAAASAVTLGVWILAPCAAAWVISLWWYGRRWEQV